jgi:protein-glutamine gamma-glutamyltransferase
VNAKAPPPLTRAQVAWLAALLLCTQAPLWGYAVTWVAVTGSALVAARLFLPPQTFRSGALRRLLLPVFAVVVGVGIRAEFGYFLARDPCVEFLYVLVGIKFVEARNNRDGALLTCLAMFLSVTQFFYVQTIFAAVAALPGLLALGGTLAALRGGSGERPAWQTQLATAARLTLQGIPLAALLFVLFPRLAGPLWGSPAEATARTGLSDRMAPGSISELSLSDAVAFRVDFQGAPPPAPPELYWRGPVLARFNGREWSAAFRLQGGKFARREGPVIQYTVTLEPHGKLWLFALEQATSLPRAASDDNIVSGPASDVAFLTFDQQLLARRAVTQTVRYTQRSALRGIVSPIEGDEKDNLQLPRSNPRTTAFARELRSRADSDRAYILAVLDWLRTEPFIYTLTPPLLARDPVDEFLFDTRRGFCEHYAGAFVVLLRAAGIPARVVTGYQGGEMNPDGGYMIVRQSDAHAWAEALVEGRWQRFDPTAAVAPSRIEHGLGAALPAGEPVPYLARLEMTWLKSLRLHWDAINYQWQRGVVGFNVARQQDLLREFGLDNAHPVELVVAIAGMTLAWGIALLGLSRLRRARVDPEVRLWSRVCRRLARAGLARRPDEGPLDFAERAASRWPRWSDPIRRIGGTYARLHYGAERSQRSVLLAQLRASVDALPGARRLGSKAN